MGKDSFTAIKEYIDSGTADHRYQYSASTSEVLAIKSVMIHPEHREKILGKAQFSRPVLDKNYISADGHFKIHYTTSGYHAVDTISTHVPGVPDWVWETAETAEYAYRLLVDTLGFDPPPQDNYGGPESDIYIKNWEGTYPLPYAYTYPEDPVTSTTDQPYDYTSYMVIDNDYQEPGYATHGIDALHVTVAHEYFHMIQLGYNWWDSNGLVGSSYGDRYFLEWSSTWFEERAYSEVNDYVQYIAAFFYRPTDYLWASNYEYAMGPFLYFLQDIYDDELLVRKIWDKIKRQYAFQSLTEVIDEKGGNLATLYNDFVRACYYTGSRYDENYAVSPDAAGFPELIIPTANRGTLDTLLQFQSDIKPFTTFPYMITFEDNQFVELDISPSIQDVFIGSYLIDKSTTTDTHRKFGMDTDVFVGETRYNDRLMILMTNSSIDSIYHLDLQVNKLMDTLSISSKILSIYANPFSWQQQKPLTIEFQLSHFTNKLSVNIFNLIGQKVYGQHLNVYDYNPGVNDIQIPADVFRSKNLSSGIYFLQIVTDRKRITKKFTLLN
ncbi:MAG: T9SS type A sorting domain-containing protein [Candidatus Marinimicrobia bacterium]|nr:T9SS type A sorting domain-containing protein [Candidatus Neomarinimicrobiota bacterium]